MRALRVPAIRERRWRGPAVPAASRPPPHSGPAITIILGQELVLPGTCSVTGELPCAVVLGFLTRGRSTSDSPRRVGTCPTIPWTELPTICLEMSAMSCTGLWEAELPASWDRHPRSRIPGAACRPWVTY